MVVAAPKRRILCYHDRAAPNISHDSRTLPEPVKAAVQGFGGPFTSDVVLELPIRNLQ